MKNYWSMRTSRDNEEVIAGLLNELREGRLRQGWGYKDDQNLDKVLSNNRHALNDAQKETLLHWRMGNGDGHDYMQKDDIVLVPNTPEYGRFTICRVTGDYYFNREPFDDYGHIRPVEVLTREGVANNHEMVHTDLRRSLRCRLRMWNVYRHRDSLDTIVDALENNKLKAEDLVSKISPIERAENIVDAAILDRIKSTKEEIVEKIGGSFRAEEYETVLQSALKHLFRVEVANTSGPAERGADLEIIIHNPFSDSEHWVVPIQVKDYHDQVDAHVAGQLETAFLSRSKHDHVIAVVLLVSNAIASDALNERMRELSNKHNVPFVYCGQKHFQNILGEGLFKEGSERYHANDR